METLNETARSPVGAPLLTLSPLCSAEGPLQRRSSQRSNQWRRSGGVLPSRTWQQRVSQWLGAPRMSTLDPSASVPKHIPSVDTPHETALSTLDRPTSVPNQPPSVDTPHETAV